ncbi:unnamed protein product, partial [Choristocarpus tenellus]
MLDSGAKAAGGFNCPFYKLQGNLVQAQEMGGAACEETTHIQQAAMIEFDCIHREEREKSTVQMERAVCREQAEACAQEIAQATEAQLKVQR